MPKRKAGVRRRTSTKAGGTNQMDDQRLEHERWRGTVDQKLDTIGRDASDNKAQTVRLGDKLDELIQELRRESQAAEARMMKRVEEMEAERIKPLEEWRHNMSGRLAFICATGSIIGGGIVTFCANYLVKVLTP